jgi:hypothetical protein
MTEERDPALRQADGTPPVPAPGGVQHDTFTVTLRLSASPGEVFRAFGDSSLRRRWFKLPGRGRPTNTTSASAVVRRLSWTEQVAFVAPAGDGNDDLRHVRGGTRLRLNGFKAALEFLPEDA